MALDYIFAEARKARLANDFANALNLIGAYREQAPDDPEAESFQGLCLVEMGQTLNAAPLIESAAAKAPDNAFVILNRSILRQAQGRFRDAVEDASAAAEKGPGRVDCWANLGAVLGKAEKFQEALAALRQANRLAPNHPGLLRLTVAAALETDSLDEAGDALKTLEKIDPKGGELHAFRAHLARKLGDWEALTEAAKAWLEAEPANEEPRIALAFGLSQRGYYERALAIYEPLASGLTPKALHLAAMGRYHLGARNLSAAEKFFGRALAIDAAEAEAHFGLGAPRVLQRRPGDGRRALSRGDRREARSRRSLRPLERNQRRRIVERRPCRN